MLYCYRFDSKKKNIMSRKTIDFGQNLNNFIELAVTQGGYKTESEYLRYLVRKDEEKHREFLELRAELQKGLDSGFSPRKRTVEEIFEAAEKRYEAKQKAKENA